MTTHSQPSQRLVLVDGSSYLYRAFHAMPALSNSQGEPTGAIRGVVSMLRKLQAQYLAQYIAVIFDAKGANFRHQLYPAYKANRPPMPDELRAQIDPLHALIKALGFPLLCIPGVEADDVIATLTEKACQLGLEVIISTGDKDLAQLVRPGVSLINTMTDEVLFDADVKEKFGVSPAQMVDYLTLMGDKVDNIPGVAKVGHKIASKWLAEYGSLAAIMAQADHITGKAGENLRAALDDLPLYKQLITVKTDVALEIDIVNLKPGSVDDVALRQLLTRFEFKSWLAELQHTKAIDSDTPSTQHNARYVCITDETVFTQWLERLQQAELFAIDTETSSLDPMQAEIIGLSFAVVAGEAAYLPLAHRGMEPPRQLDREYALKCLKPLLEDPKYAKLGHHLKYDAQVLANHGITLAGIQHDSMLQSYILHSSAHRHGLDSLSLQHLQHRTMTYEEVTGKGARQIPFAEVPLEQATLYAAEDAEISLRLHHKLWPEVSSQPPLRQVYAELEIPLIGVLQRMERHGVYVDRACLQAQSKTLARELNEMEKEAHALAGETFNLASPKQIQAILFQKLGLSTTHKTPKGQLSTAEEALEEMALEHPLPALLLAYRGLAKLKSTYTDKLPGFINPKTNRIHASYQQAVTSTGRLSCSDPNLQNIPIRTPAGRLIRQAFVAPSGRVLLAADYSQIELRIMAHLSRDQRLLAAFAAGEDVHRATAAEIFATTPEQVSQEQRRAAKAINFGLIYGMSAFGLARELKISRSDAKAYMERYFARYPGVWEYMEHARQQAAKQGYVETLYGRRLYLPDIHSRNAKRRSLAERLAINAPMQGSAADIIKSAMIRVDQWLLKADIPAMMIMQVHDELVFEVDSDAAPLLAEQVTQLMCEGIKLKVPLSVEVGIGNNWDVAH